MGARGFTLVELLLAMIIAALISVALSVVFRLGMSFLERSRMFYGSLQESLAVLSHLRRTVAQVPLASVGGDTGMVLFNATAPNGPNAGLRCWQVNDNSWTLESLRFPLPKGKDAGATSPSVGNATPTIGSVASSQAGGGEKPSPVVDLDAAKKSVLLDKLDYCSFEYLMGRVDKQQQGQTASTTATPPPSSYQWVAERGQGELAAIRINLGSVAYGLPPIVLSSVRAR